jgi:hypothetical protein
LLIIRFCHNGIEAKFTKSDLDMHRQRVNIPYCVDCTDTSPIPQVRSWQLDQSENQHFEQMLRLFQAFWILEIEISAFHTRSKCPFHLFLFDSFLDSSWCHLMNSDGLSYRCDGDRQHLSYHFLLEWYLTISFETIHLKRNDES